MKVCTKCKVERPLTDYAFNGRSGLRPVCKPCNNARKVELRAAKRPPKKTRTQLSEMKKAYYRRRRAIEMLRSGRFRGDGPCWCCRHQAVGETPYRLCIICAG